jgi:probable rRNA maturation factor
MSSIEVQRVVSHSSIPTSTQLKSWAKAALAKEMLKAELTIRIVDKEEIQMLNSTYRHKNKPTNVLSFPFEMPDGVEMDAPILGDIIICADVILEEAKEQDKTYAAHWAHMVVHGILHLQGYDHENDHDAEIMEAKEIKILKKLGFDNPYQVRENHHGE